jgi:DNA repair protein RadD
MIVLRKYQELAVEAGEKSLRKSKNNEVIVAPTASGKSVIISELCHRLDDATLILQPTKEILEQNYEKLTSYGIDDIGIYSASMNRKDIERYTYATIGSIYKKPELFRHFKYILIDECHLVNPKGFGMYKSFFKALGKPSILGLTATPYRLVQGYRNDGESLVYTSMLQVLNRIHPFFFKSFCFKITNKRLFDEKYLSPLKYIYPKKDIDLSSLRVNTTGRDFDEEAMEKYLLSPSNVSNLVEAIVQEDATMKNNLIFCSSINHANKSAELLAKMGYDCEVLTGDHSDKDRERIISDFRSGKIKRLLNVGVLSTGFDFPGLYGVTLARPTMSLALYYQMVGRSIRLDPANPNKVAKIIDITGASKRMGRIETIRLSKDGFKDQVETEVGIISGTPLFNFKVSKEKASKIIKNGS